MGPDRGWWTVESGFGKAGPSGYGANKPGGGVYNTSYGEIAYIRS
jgi:hypothetical protein